MGLFDRLKALNDPSVRRWQAAEERWAKILWVGPRMGPIVELQLEVHEGGRAPWVTNETMHVPRRIKPQVGQDVFFHRNSGDNGGREHVVVDWDEPPRYYNPAEEQASADALVERYMPTLPKFDVATPAQAASPDYQMGIVQQMFDAGQITQADYDRKMEDLRRWAADPAGEMDPAVHLARLEERRAAGQVTDAEYAQRKRDLETWAANVRPPSA